MTIGENEYITNLDKNVFGTTIFFDKLRYTEQTDYNGFLGRHILEKYKMISRIKKFYCNILSNHGRENTVLLQNCYNHHMLKGKKLRKHSSNRQCTQCYTL